MVGDEHGSAGASRSERLAGFGGHPEPDVALDDDGAVVAHAPHAHRQVVPGRSSPVHCPGSVSAMQVMSVVALAV